MTHPVFAILSAGGSSLEDTIELLSGAASTVAGEETSATAVVFGAAPRVDSACRAACAMFSRVRRVAHPVLEHPDAEMIRELCRRLLPPAAIVLMAHDPFGMDLGPGLAVHLGAVYLPDCLELDREGTGRMSAVRQVFGGQVNARVSADVTSGAVITVRPGAFTRPEPPVDVSREVDGPSVASGEGAGEGGSAQAGEKTRGVVPTAGVIEDWSSKVFREGVPGVGRRILSIREAGKGEVDITRSDVLVACGRGFESADDLELARELAEVMGADIACSRPLVDARWMEKTRQVGSSGQTVSPRVYLALGISGSFQHLAGIKGKPFLAAVNINRRAPIFQVADVGIVGDVLEVVPELTECFREGKG